MASKCIILAVYGALCLALVLSCGESSTRSEQPVLTFRQSDCLDGTQTYYRSAHGRQGPSIVGVESSGCLGGLAKTSGEMAGPGGMVRFTVAQDTVYAYHDSAYYQCCAMFDFTLEQNGEFLDFIEADTGMECDCMCYFNLRIAAAGVEPGNYSARLWTEDREFLLGEAEITVVGSGTVWFETRCDTLMVYHNPRNANCGSVFVFDYEQTGRVLTFTEIDTSSAMLRCMCDFELTAQVAGLADGEYAVYLRDAGNAHGFNGIVDSLITEATVTISCP